MLVFERASRYFAREDVDGESKQALQALATGGWCELRAEILLKITPESLSEPY
jgi:hypothetical protein